MAQATEQTTYGKEILYLVRTMRVPREQIFSAFTDPKEFKKWMGPEEGYSLVDVQLDFKTGGKYRFGMKPPHGDPYYVTGAYREIKPPLWIVQTWNWEGERTWSPEPQKRTAPESVVIIQLKERDQGKATEVFFWHNGLRDLKDVEEHKWGWSLCLDRLNNLVG